MTKDPIVEEVRRIRRQYAARFNYDLAAIFRDLQERQARGDGGDAPRAQGRWRGRHS